VLLKSRTNSDGDCSSSFIYEKSLLRAILKRVLENWLTAQIQNNDKKRKAGQKI